MMTTLKAGKDQKRWGDGAQAAHPAPGATASVKSADAHVPTIRTP